MTSGTLAPAGGAAYLPPMALLRILLLLAMLLMPLRMVGTAPAQAMEHEPAPAAVQPAAAGHCDDPAPAPNDGPPARVDCMIACASLPAASHDFVPATTPLAAPPQPAPVRFVPGIAPAADPPPPRVPLD